jgi:hypothetical protein
MRHVSLCVLLLTLGCGSKTPLGVETSEAGPADGARPDAARDTAVPVDTAPPMRPACFESLDPGTIRGSIEDVHGRPAYDREGNVYFPRESEDTWFIISLDPCLEVRWALPLGDFEARRRFNRTTVDDEGFVWLNSRFQVTRATTEGVPAPVMLEVEGDLWTWVAVPPAGPVYASTNGTDMPRYLYRTRAGGGTDRVRLEEVSSYVYDDECLVGGGAALCWNVAYDLSDMSLRYYRDPPRIIDGTFRNITQPAYDGDRIWTLRFGISNYDLVANSTEGGEEVVRVPLARTTRGQVDTIMSPPVIGAAGEVLVYFTGHREGDLPGQLQAFSRDGEPLWNYIVDRTNSRDVFTTDSMIAIGDANVAYLAVGDGLHAVVVSNGTPRWSTFGLGDVNDPMVQISPLGDVAVLNEGDVLHVVATESLAVGRTPWPVAGGNPQATYAR